MEFNKKKWICMSQVLIEGKNTRQTAIFNANLIKIFHRRERKTGNVKYWQSFKKALKRLKSFNLHVFYHFNGLTEDLNRSEH